jgi:NAD(P)-dependent dehydrogenase (short-subunit alcohol dehydrogenase family)
MNVLDQFKLDGKIALVTGGAGLYGRQIAEALAEAGAHTVMASRSLDALQRVADELNGRGLRAEARTLDQGDESSILKLRDELLEAHGRIDVLVNNAVLRCMTDGWDSAAEQFAQSMQVNATGVFMMTRAFGDAMAERGGGSIVNVGSIQGMVGPDDTLYEGLGMKRSPDYYFHKGGMIQLTRFAAAQLGPAGVRVNTVSPGGLYNDDNPQLPTFVERYNRRTFLGRMAGQGDLKGAIVFLASDASAYITGANLPVDAGYTAK